MNRRTFMRLLAGAAVAPAIGPPTPAEAAPAIKFWLAQKEILRACNTTVQTYGRGIHYVYFGVTYTFKADNVGEKEVTIPAGTLMCWADFPRMPLDGPYRICRMVKSAWKG